MPLSGKSNIVQNAILFMLEKSSYKNFELVCLIDDNVQDKTSNFIRELKATDHRCKFLTFSGLSNYPKAFNNGVSSVRGEHVVLVREGIAVINSDWIESLLEHSQREEVGVVGSKIYYPNDTINHAGIILGIKGLAGYPHRHFQRYDHGYYNRLNCIQNFSAVTGALMMVKKVIYSRVGGLDERNFTTLLNDIDFCLKVRRAGYLNVFTPYCEAYHQVSSKDRGYTKSERAIEFEREKDLFEEKWKAYLEPGDSYYNPNLTLEKEDFSIRV